MQHLHSVTATSVQYSCYLHLPSSSGANSVSIDPNNGITAVFWDALLVRHQPVVCMNCMEQALAWQGACLRAHHCMWPEVCSPWRPRKAGTHWLTTRFQHHHKSLPHNHLHCLDASRLKCTADRQQPLHPERVLKAVFSGLSLCICFGHHFKTTLTASVMTWQYWYAEHMQACTAHD